MKSARDWVPFRIPAREREADILRLKSLTDDLASDKANYVATLESIATIARRLFDDGARLTGRGYKHGNNTACRACDGVYPKSKGA